MQNSPRYALGSVDNALRLVRVLQSGEVLTVSSVADRLSIGRSTAHRLLAMLTHHGFAARGPNREYVRGPALRDPSTVLPAGLTVADVRSRLLPMLRNLTDAVRETSNVQLLMGDFTRVIASVECSQTLRVGNREGQNLPAERSSGGRALLGNGLEEIAGIWAAINDQDIESGITAIGVAIPTKNVANRLAVSIAMPSVRSSPLVLTSIATHLAQTAQAMGRTLDSE